MESAKVTPFRAPGVHHADRQAQNLPVLSVTFSLKKGDGGVSPASLRAVNDERTSYHDERTSGLSLRVSPGARPVRAWVVSYRVGGKQRRETIGRWPKVSVERAQTVAAERSNDAARGVDALAKKQKAARKGVTVEHITERFLKARTKQDDRIRPLAASTLTEWERTLRVDVLPHIGKRDAETLTLADLERVKAVVKRRGAETHAQKVAGVIKSLFSWAKRKRLITTNPASELEAAPSNIRKRVYGDDELRAIWRAAEGVGIVGALVRLLLLTGVRREDATSARWSDFKLARREWTIPRTKTGEPHVVGLSHGALRVLAAIPGDPRTDARLFPTTGELGYLHDPDLDVIRAAGAPSDFRLHDLRRTVRSRLPGLGVTPDIAERVLAHSLGGTIRRTYDHFDYAPAVAEALAKWDVELARILS